VKLCVNAEEEIILAKNGNYGGTSQLRTPEETIHRQNCPPNFDYLKSESRFILEAVLSNFGFSSVSGVFGVIH
jgi:hypothetical protein